MTAATSALVAVTLAIYAYVDLRRTAAERRDRFAEDTRAFAVGIRASLEQVGVAAALERADPLSRELSRSSRATQVNVYDARRLGRGVPPDAERRLRDLIEARPGKVLDTTTDRLVIALPLRQAAPADPDGMRVVGSVEISRPQGELDAALRSDVLHTLPLLILIVVLVVTSVMLATRTLVTRPIAKLLAGIDDVAQGDLSRVLLSEREDEIGALATRFNDMTYSLRESRAETQRQNAARIELEERLFQTEKLATIGQLAAEIAHEVGTPLNVIVGRARTMAKKADHPELVTKNADIIAEQASRITRIIQRLLDMARRKVGTVENELVDLDRLTQSTMDFLEGKFAAARVTRSLGRSERLPPVKGNPDQLQQVLLNLLLNAIEAMPDGGSVRVETSLVTRRRPGLEMAPEQPTVVISVTDNGVGIDAERREKIFEPFYTSKGERGGTGLGLSVSYGIIKEHDGWIEVDDGPGRVGTVFRVCFPAAPDSR
jgi:signal transduction histidine kinase